MGAKTELAEIEVEVVADDEDVFGRDFIELGEFLHSRAGEIVESLGFDKNGVGGFGVDGGELGGFMPGELAGFEIKIKSKKAKIMTSEVVTRARVAEANNQFHKSIITEKNIPAMGRGGGDSKGLI